PARARVDLPVQGRRYRGLARVAPLSELHRLRAGAPLHEEPRGRSAAAPRRDAPLQRAREPRAASVAGPTEPAPVSGGAAQPRASVVMVVHDGAATTRTCLEDRKSTRLNSSHDQTSYAVFCLK